MQKIDRLGWASGFCFQAYGLKIGIRCDQPEMPEEIKRCLPPEWTPADPPFVDYLFSVRIGGQKPGERVRRYHLLYAGLRRVARTMDWEHVLFTLENELELILGEWAPDRVFVHAGVVGWKGRALVLPGKSFSGKSTLVAALLRAGATYYSDEYALLDKEGRVHPYSRPLFLRTEDGKPDRHAPPEEFGSRAGMEPLPVGLVAMTRYRSGAQWHPRLMQPGRALLDLMGNTLPMQRHPERSLAALQRVVGRTEHLHGSRGEADQTAELLLRRLEESSIA